MQDLLVSKIDDLKYGASSEFNPNNIKEESSSMSSSDDKSKLPPKVPVK